MNSLQAVEKWGTFEASFTGPVDGNPFLDVTFHTVFTQGNRDVRVTGFYDGNGRYKVRFMPDAEGRWTFKTFSNVNGLEGKTGSLEVTSAGDGNHGPVGVANKFHFSYADGKPYFPFGTTCYAWTHQPEEMQTETLSTLKKTKFNKVRMGVFPKHYPYNTNEPLHRCYEVDVDGNEDFTRPNPVAFQQLEKQVVALRDLGIEADIIIFHPYDRWGYANMSAEQDYQYVAYLTARLAAYRNVWWSLANEYDFLLDTKPIDNWHKFFHIIEENDPYRHLKSIHNGEVTMNYDHRLPWVSHVCIQNWDVKCMPAWRADYAKPVINDEPEYEGNINQNWGNITAQELIHRMWTMVMRGGYGGHGETFVDDDELIWWAKGGKLHGESWERIGFLRELLEQDVKNGLEPLPGSEKGLLGRVSGAIDGDVRFIYLGEHQPAIWTLGLPKEDGDYEIDIIDTWNMTITQGKRIPTFVNTATRHGDVVRGGKPDAAFSVEMPGKPNLALRIRKNRN